MFFESSETNPEKQNLKSVKDLIESIFPIVWYANIVFTNSRPLDHVARKLEKKFGFCA